MAACITRQERNIKSNITHEVIRCGVANVNLVDKKGCFYFLRSGRTDSAPRSPRNGAWHYGFFSVLFSCPFRFNTRAHLWEDVLISLLNYTEVPINQSVNQSINRSSFFFKLYQVRTRQRFWRRGRRRSGTCPRARGGGPRRTARPRGPVCRSFWRRSSGPCFGRAPAP